jgi:hypothetical protein
MSGTLLEAPPISPAMATAQANALFSKIQHTVLFGDPKNPTAGRHLRSSWLQTPTQAGPGVLQNINDVTGLSQFRYGVRGSIFHEHGIFSSSTFLISMEQVNGHQYLKTVWNDDPKIPGPQYTEDVTSICQFVIEASIRISNTLTPMSTTIVVVPQILNVPSICVTYTGTSCFPQSVYPAPAGLAPGVRCPPS